jgi:hypothetical protein
VSRPPLTNTSARRPSIEFASYAQFELPCPGTIDHKMSQLSLEPMIPPPAHPPQDTWNDGHAPSSKHDGDCEHCKRNYHSAEAQRRGTRSYGATFTREEAQAQLRSMMIDTEINLACVKQTLRTHGDLILSRWSKKSQDKRGITLNAAAPFCFTSWPPEQATSIVPDEHAGDYMRWHPSRAKETHWSYAWWMLARLFAEDRMKLISLLHLRTEYPSQTWAMFDTIESERAFRMKGHAPYSTCCVQMFGQDYGRLVDYDESLLHTWAIMSFGRAWITMSAQHGISEILLSVVDAIVADASPSGSSKWTQFVSNSFNSGSGNSQWSPYVHPALVAPSGFDSKALLEKVRTKRNEIADELELLQTDPEYVLSLALSLKANIKFADKVPVNVRWSIIAHSVLTGRTINFRRWARVVTAYEHAHEVFEEHRQVIRPGMELPEKVGYAMRSLCCILNEATQSQCEELCNRVCETAALENCVRLGYEGDALSWKPLKDLDRRNQSHRVLASALGVSAAMGDNSACGARLWVEAFIDAISPFEYEKAVDDSLSSVALLDELRLANTWSQLGPFRAPPEETLPEQGPQRDNADPDVHDSRKITLEPADEVYRESLGQLLRKFCASPWPKDHRSPTWLDKVTESRKRLADIWQAIRDRYVQDSFDWQAEMSYLSYDLSPQYIKEVHEERELGEEQIRRSKISHAKPQSVPQVLQTTWGNVHNEDVRIKARVEKTKIKTTGPPTAEHLDVAALGVRESDSAEVDSGQAANHSPLVSIPVKQDSLSVFRKMFRTSKESTTGTIKWTQLVQALTDAGLIATQAPGAGVAFTSSDSGSINFHKPHGAEPVVDPIMLRRMGKRLKKWFGWERECFVLRAKDGGACAVKL